MKKKMKKKKDKKEQNTRGGGGENIGCWGFMGRTSKRKRVNVEKKEGDAPKQESKIGGGERRR